MTNVLDRQKGKMILADGTRFDGYLTGAGFGAPRATDEPAPGTLPVWGEVVFNTSMTGYQEVITDPSYAGQIVVMTYPQIGNYGACPQDDERNVCAARALVVRELSPFFSPAPQRISLESFMVDRGLPGLTGVDTRALTKHIRSRGAVMAAIGSAEHRDEDLLALAANRSFSRGESLVESVSGRLEDVTASAGGGRVAVVDLGAKQSILDRIHSLGAATEAFPASFDAFDILGGGFDYAVLSNGPGDPTDVPHIIAQVERMLGQIPVLGICLGHQIAAIALGGRTYKLKFGHHGANQPVVDHRTGRVFVTSQNHGYTVDDDIARRAGASITYTNANDGTLEGFAVDGVAIECVQFHPEASPGPHDTASVFADFHSKLKGKRNAACA